MLIKKMAMDIARAAFKPFSKNRKLSISWPGLSISRRIAELRNGMIYTKSTGVNSNPLTFS